MPEDTIQSTENQDHPSPPPKHIKYLHRLRTRMGLSFVLVTLVIVLIIEVVISAAIYTAVTRTPILGYIAMTRADQAARTLALQAVLEGGGEAIDPGVTFEPGHPSTLSLRREDDPPDISWFNFTYPYIAPGTPPPERPTFALLVGADETVIASSFPDRYPVSATVSTLLPQEMDIIRSALAGTSDGALRETPQGPLASVARTVWNRDEQPVGAVFIQAPGGVVANTSLFDSVTTILLPSALGWLCLMLPVGLLFGVLTTHGLILRIERLARASERYAGGDLNQRVPVQRPDEVGQLEHQFNRMAEQLVSSFAERQAQAEESARREERARIEQEMASAHYIQQSLLPVELPSIPGWEVKRHYQPARQVGGDLYDFLSLSDGKIGIVIGDATGKGMSAALIMATTCAMLRAAAPASESPGRALALVNNLLQVHIPPATFVTCFYGVLEPSSGRLRFANAGHSLPYRARNGQIAELRAAGLPLGLMPDQDYPEGEVLLSPGDNILLHTDGLVEAHDPQGEMFGAPRLAELLPRLAAHGEVIPSLLAALADFTGPGWEQEDDVTLILLQHSS